MAGLAKEFQVGVIVKPHGVHGEACVFPTTDDPERFRELKEIWLDTPGEGRKKLEIKSVKRVKKFVVLKFEGIDTVEQIQIYRSCPLIVDREHASPLSEGEYYIADVIGLSVFDADSGEELGVITDVIQTGANDVYEMRMNSDDRTIMLPAIRDCIKRISPEDGRMDIHVMKGLMD